MNYNFIKKHLCKKRKTADNFVLFLIVFVLGVFGGGGVWGGFSFFFIFIFFWFFVVLISFFLTKECGNSCLQKGKNEVTAPFPAH